MATSDRKTPHVVILGAGFGGLTAAQSLRRAPVRVTVVDRRNHHLFQPLLYQVAMAGLSPADIAMPIRSILRKQRNATVLLDEVCGIDLPGRVVRLRSGTELAYDFLVYAAGATNFYFGHEEWEGVAPGLKSIEDAVEIRRRVLLAFERAESVLDDDERKKLLTFAVIGGGPTGVELAGAIAELAKKALAREFRRIDPRAAKVILIEAGPRILPTFDPELSIRAVDQLSDLGVDVRVGAPVTSIDEHGLVAGGESIAAATVVWGAGVAPTPLGRSLGVALDRAGRILVEPDLTIPGHETAYAIGDAAAFVHTDDGKPLPGVSPVAMQQARAVARSIVATIDGRPRERFEYWDKGTMATIGRKRAIAQAGKMRMTGLLAWLAWLVVHVWYLIGFRNRIAVMLSWAYSYATYKRGARLITGDWDPDLERARRARRPSTQGVPETSAPVAPYATAAPDGHSDSGERKSGRPSAAA
jgi:NADH dehydrogenase